MFVFHLCEGGGVCVCTYAYNLLFYVWGSSMHYVYHIFRHFVRELY